MVPKITNFVPKMSFFDVVFFWQKIQKVLSKKAVRWIITNFEFVVESLQCVNYIVDSFTDDAFLMHNFFAACFFHTKTLRCKIDWKFLKAIIYAQYAFCMCAFLAHFLYFFWCPFLHTFFRILFLLSLLSHIFQIFSKNFYVFVYFLKIN